MDADLARLLYGCVHVAICHKGIREQVLRAARFLTHIGTKGLADDGYVFSSFIHDLRWPMREWPVTGPPSNKSKNTYWHKRPFTARAYTTDRNQRKHAQEFQEFPRNSCTGAPTGGTNPCDSDNPVAD